MLHSNPKNLSLRNLSLKSPKNLLKSPKILKPPRGPRARPLARQAGARPPAGFLQRYVDVCDAAAMQTAALARIRRAAATPRDRRSSPSLNAYVFFGGPRIRRAAATPVTARRARVVPVSAPVDAPAMCAGCACVWAARRMCVFGCVCVCWRRVAQSPPPPPPPARFFSRRRARFAGRRRRRRRRRRGARRRERVCASRPQKRLIVSRRRANLYAHATPLSIRAGSGAD